MSEAGLVRKIEKAVKASYPAAYVVKLSDRYRRGLPDLLVISPLTMSSVVTLLIETKTHDGRLSKIQLAEHAKIRRAGGNVVVAKTVAEVLTALKGIFT